MRVPLVLCCIFGAGLLLSLSSSPAPHGMAYRPGDTLRCIAPDLLLRAEPRTNAARLGFLRHGEPVRVEAVGTPLTITIRGVPCTRPWYRVRTARGKSGWAFGAYLHPRVYGLPVAGVTNVLPGRTVFTIGWSRDGKAAVLVKDNYVYAQTAPAVRLSLVDARSGQELTNIYIGDPWDLQNPRRQAVAVFWDWRKIDVHAVLNVYGIEPGGDPPRLMTAPVSRSGITFQLRRIPGERNAGGIILRKTALARYGSAISLRLWSMEERNRTVNGYCTSPFGPEILFLVGDGEQDGYYGFHGDSFTWTMRDRMPRHVVRVRDTAGLLAAIAPGREIRLAPGRYLLNRPLAVTNRWMRMDQTGLKISGVTDLSLVGEGKVELVADDKDAVTLSFSSSAGISLRNLAAGHVEIRKGTWCTAGVVNFSSCADVALDSVTLWGCGSWGLQLGNVLGFLATDTTLTNCTEWALLLFSVRDATFRNCRIADNPAWASLLRIDGCREMRFTGCRFENNRIRAGQPFVDGGSANTNVVFAECRITGNAYGMFRDTQVGGVRFERCRMERNTTVTNQ